MRNPGEDGYCPLEWKEGDCNQCDGCIHDEEEETMIDYEVLIQEADDMVSEKLAIEEGRVLSPVDEDGWFTLEREV